MKRLQFLFLSVLALLFSACSPKTASALSADSEDIVVLYDNDVHCAIDGYAKIASLKKDFEAAGSRVILVSNGDFVQGGSIGAISKGGYVVDIMNAVGYDFVTLGNHEFDYGMDRLSENTEALTAKVVDCNLYDLRTDRRMFDAYSIVDCGGLKIAFLGVSTPYSFASSTPKFFMDESGQYVYSLSGDTIYDTVQNMVDDARESGADIVVAMTHLGVDVESDPVNSLAMIAATSGIDIVLDGHSHSIIEGDKVKNRMGKDVLLTSTGAHFENIGVLRITPDGSFASSLVPCSDVDGDSATEAVISGVKEEFARMGTRHIGFSRVLLRAKDDEGNWLVRNGCTALGDFVSDAFRVVLGTDIACIGGGSLRANIPEGEITFDSIYSVLPFGNASAVATLSGAKILDMLEFSLAALPSDFGGFLHVSNLRYDVDLSVESPVVVNDKKMFVRVDDGPRRVSRVEVLGQDGLWQPIDPARSYTVGSTDYLLLNSGDGYAMFDSESVVSRPETDVEVLEKYITDHLGGIIPETYSSSRLNIRE